MRDTIRIEDVFLVTGRGVIATFGVYDEELRYLQTHPNVDLKLPDGTVRHSQILEVGEFRGAPCAPDGRFNVGVLLAAIHSRDNLPHNSLLRLKIEKQSAEE